MVKSANSNTLAGKILTMISKQLFWLLRSRVRSVRIYSMNPPIRGSRFAAPLIRGFFSHTFSLVTTCPARNVSRTSAYEVLSIIITTLVKYITACNITTLLLYYWLRVSLESVLEAFCTVYMDVFLTTSNIRGFSRFAGRFGT